MGLRGGPLTRGQPHRPRGAPVCPCASVLGAWELLGTAQQHRKSVTGSSPLALPSPRSHPPAPPMLFWNLGSCVKVAGLGFRDAVRAGAGLEPVFQPSLGLTLHAGQLSQELWAARAPGTACLSPSSQCEGPWDWMTSAPSAQGRGKGASVEQGRAWTRPRRCHHQDIPCPGQGQS